MIVNVCASSISREPLLYTTSYSNYYYTERQSLSKPDKSAPKRDPRKKSFSVKSLPAKFEKKWHKLIEKLRSLIVSKFAKFA